MERYQDKVVLITGAGDVAEAAAKRLLCEGAKVAFSDFSQEALDAAISGLKAEGWDGERLMGIKCDVRKYEECEAAANAVLARWGQIDTLVATAGIIRHCPIDEMTEAQWQDVVDINLTGVFHAVKSVVPSMKERKYGHIVVISSIGGRTGRPGVGVNYAATKAGVNGLVMCLGYELGPWQITVNSVAPGPLKGKMFDTMIAHYVLQPELRHGMDYLAEIYLKYETIKIEELIGAKGKKQGNMRDLAPEAVYKYACEDADVTLKLKQVLGNELETNGVKKLFEEIEMPLVPVLAYMERNGVRIDTEALKETSRHFTARMNQIEEEVHQLAGMEFNIASPKQVGEVLFDRLKIVEKAKKTKTGQYVTSEEVLESLRGKHEIVGKILELRGLKKLLGTYIDALPQLINPATGRIHTSFNQTVTATGRLSSSNPNLQNIPIRNEDGKEIRKAFIPDEGSEFFSADYSQIELRIMAHLSNDPHMIEAFQKDQDIHAATAAKIYKVKLEEVTREQRSKAKTANFGIIYGISVFGLAERLNVDRKEAKALIDGYFENYPNVKAYMDQSIQEAREKGYIETIFKRKRYLPDINSKNAVVRGYAERNAINAPIQGSAADIIKVAMIRIYQRFQEEGIRSKMILQVHDELNFSVLPEEKEKVQQIVISEMEAAYKMKAPLRADHGWGHNWLEAH